MGSKKCTPPALARRFLLWFLRSELSEEVAGDLDERFYSVLENKSFFRARVDYWFQVFHYMRPFAIRKSRSMELNQYTMFQSYFKIGWRNLTRNKGYSAINITGLTAGMVVAILIGLWVFDEISFNDHFKNHARLTEVMLNQTYEGIVYTGPTVAPTIEDGLRTKFGADFKALALVSWENNHIISGSTDPVSADGLWVQSDFPEMFTLLMTSGDRSVLKDPSSVLISRSLAKALFAGHDPLNKTVRIDSRLDMKVAGVYEDMPHNTQFSSVKILLPWHSKENWLNTITDWDNHSCRMFAQLADHAQVDLVSEKIKALPTPHITSIKEEIMLLPLDQLHLYTSFKDGKTDGGGRIQFVWLVGTIGIFVLLLACINFMNLSTARSDKRAKEVGIRKTVGSLRNQLVGQFLTESLIFSFGSLVFSLLIVMLLLPFFNILADKKMFMPWAEPMFWMMIVGFALFTGIVSGSYPAFYLSSFRPVKVLKGTFKAGRTAGLSRKVLVVLQFTVSITLTIGTVVILKQIEFAKDRPLGFSREGLVTITINTPDLRNHYEAIRGDLLQSGTIENLTRSSQTPAHFGNNNGLDWPGKNLTKEIYFRNVNVTADYGEVLGWTITRGRDFSADLPTDSSAVILNQAALKLMGLKDPIGQTVTYEIDKKQYTIIGEVKDMMTQSPYTPVDPAVFFLSKWLDYYIIRIKSNVPVNEALGDIERVFRKHNPDAPFEYAFVDEEFARKFSDDERTGKLAGIFAGLSVFISCLGIFGLASFMAEQRTKEIGVRKVLGASIFNLWKMLSQDFVLLVVVSCLVAVPLAFYFMNDWLSHYQYRTELSWYVFVSTVSGALVITLLTVSYQAVRAAMMNPVNSLRSE